MQQLKELMAPHLPEHIEVNFSGFSKGRHLWNFDTWLPFQRRSVFILVKNLGYRMTAQQLDRLREKAVAVGLDHVDGDFAKVDLSLFDFHISSSLAGLSALTEIIAGEERPSARDCFADVLFQSPDTRLKGLRFGELDRLSTLFLGLPSNADIPKGITDQIDSIEVNSNKQMVEALSSIPRYNMHFAVRLPPRPDLRRVYKPFTKGVIAAECRSNIIVNRQVDDAVEFLTPDYPYLVASNDPAQVEDVFRQARDGFGGAEWHRGLEIMKDVREKVSGAALAAQFTRIVTRAADQGAPG